MPAKSGFDRVRDNLLQRRIGDEEIGQAAGCARIGAGEFRGRRRAVGFGITGVKRHAGRNVIGRADGGIEPAVFVIAVQCSAETVVQRDAAVVVTCRNRDRERIDRLEHIGEINSDIIVFTRYADRRDRTVVLVDDNARALEAAFEGHRADGGRGGEIGAPAVIARAHEQLVVVAEQRRFVDRLHGATESEGTRRGSVQLRIGAAIEKSGIGSPFTSVATSSSRQRKPEPSSQGARSLASPLAVRWRR